MSQMRTQKCLKNQNYSSQCALEERMLVSSLPTKMARLQFLFMYLELTSLP